MLGVVRNWVRHRRSAREEGHVSFGGESLERGWLRKIPLSVFSVMEVLVQLRR